MQLDKTGMGTPIALKLEYNGNKANKRPMFSNLTWRYIDMREVKRIRELFDFAETVLQFK